MTVGSLFLAFAAGVLSILSPCVLPILPIVLGAAAARHRLGAVALAAGLTLSFVGIGLFIATIGFSAGIDRDTPRYVAAILMTVIGIVLVLPPVQARLAMAGGPLSAWTGQRMGEGPRQGCWRQFGLGLLLGVVWSPCVGPTLGAASLLAAQGRDLSQVGTVMFAFGLGAAAPLLALGILSREALLRGRLALIASGRHAKIALGAFFIATGLLILLGWDKGIEAFLVDSSPQWLTELTTRF